MITGKIEDLDILYFLFNLNAENKIQAIKIPKEFASKSVHEKNLSVRISFWHSSIKPPKSNNNTMPANILSEGKTNNARPERTKKATKCRTRSK
ncbi:hypothetical protein GCM10022277_04360 [Litoribacillus peritrichatus]|uniref:Uncharacterized protein n=1 Tax=Litoribacillus peritrichatus TaxID=718191 RepID=A0ABP7M1H8_9GAMM